jgi:hypothetical protein
MAILKTTTINGTLNNINITPPSGSAGTLTIGAGKTLTVTQNATIAHSTHASGSDNQTITAGKGMDFTASSGNVTITMGTPGDLTADTISTATTKTHTHSISTAAASGLSASTENGAGTSTSLARADHTHKITGFEPSHGHPYLPNNLGVTITAGGNIAASSATFSGQVNASSFNAISKREMKENIETYKGNAVEALNKIEIVEFNFKNDEKKEKKIGFIADDTDSLFSGLEKDHVDIYNVIGALIKSVQELDARVKYLEEKYGI